MDRPSQGAEQNGFSVYGIKMDVLKELFGTQDELHIAKSLFGNEDNQGSLQIGT